MKKNFLFILVCWLFAQHIVFAQNNPVSIMKINHVDKLRHRHVPVLIYSNEKCFNKNGKPIVIISHGYTIKNSEYSFIANTLAAKGYTVISIQHDLKNDPPLATTGSLYLRRKPLWERGVQNILFVLNDRKQIQLNIDSTKLILIGHSNGGDISMLFASKYPQLVSQVISLDSLRMPFPKNKNLKILTLRAIDTKADDGVLPNKVEQEKFGIHVIKLKNARHIDLCDRGSTKIKCEVDNDILNFLKENS